MPISNSTLEEILFNQGLLTSDQLSGLKLESINSGISVEKILLTHNLVPIDKITHPGACCPPLPYYSI